MTHDEIIAEIQERAETRGLLHHHCRNSRSCTGTRGFPDVFITGTHGAALLEAKAGHDYLSPDQTTWYHTLTAAGQLVAIVREHNLHDGSLDRFLDKLTGE